MKILVLSALCATNFLSHGMEVESYGMDVEPTQEAIGQANLRLLDAAKMGNFAEVKQLITESVADLNIQQGQDQWTPLLFACCCNYTAIALALIEAGADVNVKNFFHSTPLKHASINKNIELINVLVEAGADVNAIDSSGHTALVNAIWQRDLAIVLALIEVGADVNVRDKDGISVLALAIKYNRSEIIMPLINPVVKPIARKKIETLLMIYNEGHSQLSLLPREILKIILTCAMDRELVLCLHPQVLVDNVPLETLAMFIKDGTLDQGSILAAWQNKITSIVQSLKTQKLEDKHMQRFATDALTKITMSLT